MSFNNGHWLCKVYKSSAFFRGITGHFIVPGTTRLQRYSIYYSVAFSCLECEFQGHHTNQAYHKSGIMPPAYHEIKGVDGELWLRVKFE